MCDVPLTRCAIRCPYRPDAARMEHAPRMCGVHQEYAAPTLKTTTYIQRTVQSYLGVISSKKHNT